MIVRWAKISGFGVAWPKSNLGNSSMAKKWTSPLGKKWSYILCYLMESIQIIRAFSKETSIQVKCEKLEV
jgi:hypothetical protein